MGWVPRVRPTAKDLNDSINHLIQGGGSEPAHAIEDDLGVGGKEAVGSNVTRLFQSAFGEIRIRNRHGIAVLDRLARDLAENEVIAAKVAHGERRAAFGLTEVREGKRNNHHVAFYKSRHAASSSDDSQSFFSDDSLAERGVHPCARDLCLQKAHEIVDLVKERFGHLFDFLDQLLSVHAHVSCQGEIILRNIPNWPACQSTQAVK